MNKHTCPQCGGDCELECSLCGSEIDCPTCGGHGLNPDDPDVKRLLAQHHEHAQTCCDWWGVIWIDEHDPIGIRCANPDCDWKAYFAPEETTDASHSPKEPAGG